MARRHKLKSFLKSLAFVIVVVLSLSLCFSKDFSYALAPKAKTDTQSQLEYFEAALRLEVRKRFGKELQDVAYDSLTGSLKDGDIQVAPLTLEIHPSFALASLPSRDGALLLSADASGTKLSTLSGIQSSRTGLAAALFHHPNLEALLKDSNGYVRQAAAPAVASVYVADVDQLMRANKPLWLLIPEQDLFEDYLMLHSLAGGKPSSYAADLHRGFRAAFNKVNDPLPENRRIQQASFFSEHQPHLVFLMEVMGYDTYRLLRGFLGSDPYPLRRFFDTLELQALPSGMIQSLRALYAGARKKDFSAFQKILEMVSAYADIGAEDLLFEQLEAGQGKPWDRIYGELARAYLKQLAQTLEIETSALDPTVLERFPK